MLNGDSDYAKFLINFDIEVDVITEGVPLRRLSHPLILTATYEDVGLVKALIAKGANVNVVATIGEYETNPLAAAMLYMRPSVIKILLEHGATLKVLKPKAAEAAIDKLLRRVNGGAVTKAVVLDIVKLLRQYGEMP
jgi:hypothetical protein